MKQWKPNHTVDGDFFAWLHSLALGTTNVYNVGWFYRWNMIHIRCFNDALLLFFLFQKSSDIDDDDEFWNKIWSKINTKFTGVACKNVFAKYYTRS